MFAHQLSASRCSKFTIIPLEFTQSNLRTACCWECQFCLGLFN